ncbi:MAG: pyridoxamine 5'-phosphate oxidase [Acidobacteria bacterium]|nr:pyridoxamine 5'-phosphate oxidase [Acidobacteriota bacterium]
MPPLYDGVRANMASSNPITEFLDAAERARAHQVDTAPAALATADRAGRPSVRMVLLRGVDERGFVFFTNYHSRKGRELDQNPQAALCFHWIALDEQIRIEGTVERLSGAESDDYFASRPRGSQLGAWASDQSAPLPSRETLETKYREVEARFGTGAISRPPFWGGYRLVPRAIEFWYGRPDRLHDRVLYTRDGSGWTITRLYP